MTNTHFISVVNPVDEGGIPGVMASGVPPANMRQYYPNQPHLAVSTTGPPPTSVQLPVSGGQMVMYPPHQMQQLMQPGHGGYQLPVGYSPLQYGFPQHGGQPHVTYVSPSVEALSPESVHMGPPPPQTHPKSHHEGHNGMTHSSAGPSGSSKGRNQQRDNVKQQQQQPPYYYG